MGLLKAYRCRNPHSNQVQWCNWFWDWSNWEIRVRHCKYIMGFNGRRGGSCSCSVVCNILLAFLFFTQIVCCWMEDSSAQQPQEGLGTVQAQLRNILRSCQKQSARYHELMEESLGELIDYSNTVTQLTWPNCAFLSCRYIYSDNWGALTPFIDLHNQILEGVGLGI